MKRAFMIGGAIAGLIVFGSMNQVLSIPVPETLTRSDSRSKESIQKTSSLTPRKMTLADGRSVTLSLPQEFQIRIAAQGMKRIRFMAKSPDDRIFLTDMFNLTDNRKGSIYILDRFDPKTGQFGQRSTYLTNLRNPNSIAFHVEPNGKKWLYIALTDRLIRYRYHEGDVAPNSAPEVLAKFPDYGLSYKYGGWHLTRTVAIADQKVYVSVGSSCNSCEEKESVRAAIVEMDLDGKHQRIFAKGLRNAVGIKWAKGQLFATNMGSDHLGDDRPEETLDVIRSNQHYGFPYCFQYGSKLYADPQYRSSSHRIDCKTVPIAPVTFAAHSAPLGLEYFNDTHSSPLKDSFLVALHGGSKRSLKRGYQVMQVKPGTTPTPFITGFLQEGTIYGRPVDILSVGPDAFLVTDDYYGVVYYVSRVQS